MTDLLPVKGSDLETLTTKNSLFKLAKHQCEHIFYPAQLEYVTQRSHNAMCSIYIKIEQKNKALRKKYEWKW
jgi:hypothetical protein